MARPGTPSRSSRGQLHVGRYFAVLALLLGTLYSVVFLTGDAPTPRLGLDLQGGASVVLTPQTTTGQAPRPDQLATAVQIIQQRVNGLGVAEAEVVTQGDNIVVSVPGGTRDSLRSLAQTAQLRFREVVQSAPGDPDAPLEPAPSPAPAPTGPPASGGPDPTASPGASSSVVVPAPTGAATPRGRALPPALVRTEDAPGAQPAQPLATLPPGSPPVKSGDAFSPGAFGSLDCSVPNARRGGSTDKPEEPIVACSDDGAVKYQLAEAKVVGTDVAGATAALDQSTGSQWQIVVDFTGAGQNKFTDLTAATVNKQVAIVLDGLVLSAPTIQTRIDSDAQITGDFTQESSNQLANTLKYGALPLSFENSQVEVVSATLGDDQLRAGLLAGGLGLAAVVVYSIAYYRILGLVTVLGLTLSGLIIYASVVILGRQVGFALSLAGIAGLLVAVGITADSFVVYFERLKDEIREGRTPRAAADRAWVRARRTILSANTVSFLAAIILYFLSVGSVRGFAFTLGLSTLIDVLVVFLFTRPLVSFLSRFRWFTNPTLSGMAVSKDLPAADAPRVRRPAVVDQEA